MINQNAVDPHATERQEIATALQNMRASDNALDDAETRALLRKVLGLEAKTVVIADRRHSPIPESPIRSVDVLRAYLERGFSVQPHLARTTSPVGKLRTPRDLDEMRKGPYISANVPLNATVTLQWSNSIALVFETGFDAELLSRFEADIDPLVDVPVIAGAARSVALLTIPSGFYRTGNVALDAKIHAHTSQIYRVIAPPSFDPDASLKPLRFRDPNVTVPATPSKALTAWLRAMGVIHENMR